MKGWHIAVGLGVVLLGGVGLWWALRPAGGNAGAAAAAAPEAPQAPRQSTAEKAGEFFAGAITRLAGGA